MKRISILMLLSVIVGLSSCTNNDNINLTVTPKADSVSKGSFVKLSFNVGFTTKTFAINDLVVKNSAIYTMTELVNNVQPDSFWAAAYTLTDHTSKQISFNLSLNRDSLTELGDYVVKTNTSTLTDFSAGSNQVYEVLPGSIVTLTYISSHYAAGTMSLNLYSNHDSTLATGSFQIYK